jgi:enoyl-CoA hydratase/carnithine racemase
MTSAPVTYGVADGVAWITLNRPAVLNALDMPLTAALADAAEAAAADPDVTLVIVRGAGRAFCSGMDRTALAAGSIGEAFHRAWVRALNRLEDMPKVSLCVLHGYSIGGGLQIGLACDLRLATDDAVLGLGASSHGIIPDGAVLRLARLIGLARAKELALLNEHVTPPAALAMGLINWVCPAAGAEATLASIIGRVREQAPTANAHIKRLLHESVHRDPRAAVEDVMAAELECLASWEAQHANRDWQEKRTEPTTFYPRPPTK